MVAPYATGLATMVDPQGARSNYARLAAMGASSRYGFYEALDFTSTRLPEDERVAIVRTVMAHHQGMTIVAIANALQDGRMRARFHREPMIQASELLLQERMPRDVAVAHPRAEELNAAATAARTVVPTVRRISASPVTAPITHLLSNGRYAVMLTAVGAGYSRWRDIAVTRWREDATCDDWGSFIVLRDMGGGPVWSAGAQPVGSEADDEEVVFGEDHAQFFRRDGTLTTIMDVLVSGEHDGEVRRVSLTNSGRQPREIELTSYAELVLTTPAADAAHPAFAKMFVETEHVAEFGALVATRRPRSHGEPQVFAAHFAVVEGDIVDDPQYETDRARFIGRGRTVGTAAGVADGRPLSNTVGTVLDPVFSLRRRVVIPPGRVARVAFWTVVASSRAELLDLSTSCTTAMLTTAPGPWRGPRPRCSSVISTSMPRRRRISSAWRRRSCMPIPASEHPRMRSCAERDPSPPCGRMPSRATSRSSSCGSTMSRISPRSASSCARTSTGA